MKKFISKLGLAVSAFALVIGAMALNSCEKEQIEYNKDIPGGQVVIPGTDLTSVEQLLTQIKDYLVKEQKAQLETLLQQIAGDNAEIKAKLDQIIADIEAGKKTDAEIKALLEQILKELQDWHYPDPHDPHGHGTGNNAGGGISGK